MTATESAGAPEGVAQDVEAPVAEQAIVGPLTGDPAIVGVPTFVVGSVTLGVATSGKPFPLGHPVIT